MKTLYWLRHAKSSWAEAGLSDHDRPLNKRGKKAAPRMGQLLADRDLLPDLIICSTAVRARQTVELLVPESGYSGQITFEPRLYMAPREAYWEVLGELDDEFGSVMTVAHNPGISNVLLHLTDCSLHFPTAGPAQIELPIDRWSELESDTSVRLVEFWRPKELD